MDYEDGDEPEAGEAGGFEGAEGAAGAGSDGEDGGLAGAPGPAPMDGVAVRSRGPASFPTLRRPAHPPSLKGGSAGGGRRPPPREPAPAPARRVALPAPRFPPAHALRRA